MANFKKVGVQLGLLKWMVLFGAKVAKVVESLGKLVVVVVVVATTAGATGGTSLTTMASVSDSTLGVVGESGVVVGISSKICAMASITDASEGSNSGPSVTISSST